MGVGISSRAHHCFGVLPLLGPEFDCRFTFTGIINLILTLDSRSSESMVHLPPMIASLLLEHTKTGEMVEPWASCPHLWRPLISAAQTCGLSFLHLVLAVFFFDSSWLQMYGRRSGRYTDPLSLHFRPLLMRYPLDDGSGSVTILEAYRGLIAANFHPDRTPGHFGRQNWIKTSTFQVWGDRYS